MKYAISIINHQIVELEKLIQVSPSIFFNIAQKELKQALEILDNEKKLVIIENVKIKGFTPLFGDIECDLEHIRVHMESLNNSINKTNT